MKLTSSFIVYLNESNKVHCAKCRITGKLECVQFIHKLKQSKGN